MTKKERWDFRVATPTDELVRQAAATTERSLTSDFVVEAALIEAERVLADRTAFALPPKEWDRFVELLDRPPRVSLGLEKLFASPSVLSAE